jgi:hypothetical protein
MSVLETPRILFHGEVAWDPITTNNYPKFYDETTDESVLPKVPPGIANQVAAFRANAVAAVMTGNWNPQGTHRSTFYKTRVSGVDYGGGVTKDDPFVHAAANFTGMLVDLEPYGAFSSQLFFDSIRFGVDGGYRILGKRSTRMTARYINFARNPANAMIAGVASVVWQTTFRKADGLVIDAFDSPALLLLKQMLQDDDVAGLTVQFNTYRTVYYDNPALLNGSPLTVKMAQGLNGKLNRFGGAGFQPNPARSEMVGVIGLWRKDEPVHEPGDRTLIPPGASPFGAAHARLTGTSLTLDLSNTVPEIKKDLEKQNFGTVAVVAADPASGATTAIGSLPYAVYDREAYVHGSGIMTLPLTPAQAQAAEAGDIQLLDENNGLLLAEEALRVVPQQPNAYLDEGTNGTGTFQVYNHGAPLRAVTPVALYPMAAGGNGPTGAPQNLNTDANGVLSVPLDASANGVFAFVPTADGNAPAGGINPQVNTYMYVRVLAADADTAALAPTWDNVYAKVLANWNAMAPCMDNWLMLNDPVAVKAHAPILKRLTDPKNFENYLYMPVVRDMTAGERTLLYAFLDAPDGGTATVGLAAAHTAPAAAPAAPHDKLSRAMRGG